MTSSYGEKRWGENRRGEGQVGAEHDTPAQSVGADLRDERERLGWTLPALAAHLRIRLPFLEAIEDGRTADLPGTAYAIGFIRTYAQAVGLDPAAMAAQYRAEAGAATRKTELDFPAPVPERGVPALAVVLVGVVVAIGAYAGWYRMSGNLRPSADAVQRVPERLAALVPDRPAPPATAPPAAPPAPAASAATAFPPPNLASAAAAIPSPPASGTLQTATLEPSAAEPAPARADGARVVLHARADAWMLVRDKGGHEFLNRVLKAGETWPVPQKANLLLSTGNAAATDVLVDGVSVPSLGGSGVVRHDLPLDPDAMKGRLAAVPARPFVSPRNQ